MVAIACWAASLYLPTVETVRLGAIAETEVYRGWDIVLVGIWGSLMAQFGWFANLLFIPGLVLAAGSNGKAPLVKLIIGVLLLALVVNSAFWSSIPNYGDPEKIIGYREGYWLWMAVMTILGLWLVVYGIRLPGDRHMIDPGEGA